jgi:PAS domain S-box-containing protein
MTQEFRLSRLWPWIEKTAPRRFAFAAVLAAMAAGLHWLIFPITQSRVTFIFFIPATVLATTIAGRWPGVLVAVVGIINSAAMKAPGTLMVPNSAEQVALISSALVSLMVILAGDYYRSISRRELSDLYDLHELSATLASIPALPEQLQLILSTFARMHGAAQGIIATYPARGDVLGVSASVGFGDEGKTGSQASGLTFVDRTRVVIADTETEARAVLHRERFRALGIRSVHSTPLISRDGEILGVLSVYFGTPLRLSDREIRIADICARKAAVFIERARAEDQVSQRDRRFQSVLESSGVPFIVFSPVRDDAGKIVDFRFTFLNTAAAKVMRVRPGEYAGRKVTDVLPRAWDDRARFAMYVEALERNEVRQSERQSEADGNSNWYHIVASPLDGDIAVWFADVTSRKMQERDLVEADRRKDEFLATLAHELRNPLAPIRQAATILRNENAGDAQKRWSSNVIERQVQHMSVLLDDLLDVSRITHGTLQLRKQHSDLQSILAAAVETARPLIDERHHALALDVPEGLQVNADPFATCPGAFQHPHQRGQVHLTQRFDPRAGPSARRHLVDHRGGQRHRHRSRGIDEGVRHVRAGAGSAGTCGRGAGHRAGAGERHSRASWRPHRSGERRGGQGQSVHRVPAEQRGRAGRRARACWPTRGQRTESSSHPACRRQSRRRRNAGDSSAPGRARGRARA